MKNITKYLIGITTALALTAAVAVPAFAASDQSGGESSGDRSNNSNVNRTGMWTGQPGQGRGMMGAGVGTRPGIFGTVSAINGNILTVVGRGPGANQASTTYTVDATNSTVVKNNATTTISAVLVGDTVSVRGTVSGTSVTATSIRDGLMMRGPGYVGPGGNKDLGGDKRTGTSTWPTQNPIIKGNGQPVVAGTVATVSGSTLTITTTSNVTYTIDATNATIAKGNATSTISNSSIAVGDYVVVQGVINGTSVTASSVIDQPANPANGNNGYGMGRGAAGGGLFGSIGQFFKHLFGF